MLISCNSCQKKFIVPDNAITESGRLVQCGSCGIKWTQYPVKIFKLKEEKTEKNKFKKTNSIKKSKQKKNLYTAEYLKKKHGLIIENNVSQPNKTLNKKTGFGFYSYLVFLFVFLITLFGVLELTKEIIILKYPFLETYINYLYEVIEIIKLSIIEFIY